MALVFAVMHLYNVNIFIASVHSFFNTLRKSGIDKSMEWSTIAACPSLTCFCNRSNTEGTNSSKSLRLMCVFYVLCGFVSGLILRFLDNLWFDDSRTE